MFANRRLKDPPLVICFELKTLTKSNAAKYSGKRRFIIVSKVYAKNYSGVH